VDQQDEEQFRQLAAARSTALLRLAVGLTQDRHLAEDLLQSTLTKAFVHWRRVRQADDPDAYLKRILVTTYLSQVRRRRVREVLTFTVHDPAPELPTYGVVDRATLLPALRKLGPKQRAVIVLRYYEDRSDADIAALLGCSQATVRSQAMRALATLRADPDLVTNGDLR